jgi:cysteinyl-tRNA synthetase
LHQAQQSLERLRNFRFRLRQEKFPAGENAELQARAQAALASFENALDDNLNTAEALGAVFDLVREGNTAMDEGKFRDGDRAAFLKVLESWDRVFAVLDDNDFEKLRKLGFVKTVEGAAATEAPVAAGGAPPAGPDGYTSAVLAEALPEAEIEKQIAGRNEARRRGDFARADQIRSQLAQAGVIIEDTKSGTRWKRK